MSNRRFRICVTTSYGATEEPRGPRYAAALAAMNPEFDVVFVDCVPQGKPAILPVEFEAVPNVRLRTWHFPWRGGGKFALLKEKIQHYLARSSFRRGGQVQAAALSTRCIGLERALIDERADLYFGFNIDTLLPVYNAARIAGVPFMFDCHEIHAEMAHFQSDVEKAAILAAQHLCLQHCALVLAASPEAAAYIEKDFDVTGVLPLLNAAPITELPAQSPVGDFSLYWRNNTLDLGMRGLDDILRAMPLLPSDITLYVQGRPPHDGTARVDQMIRELGIANRVVILPPYLRRDAVMTAVPYTVGLSLESPSCINMDLTSTNKLFEYAMAGLAVVSTRTRGMENVIEANGLGLFYTAGDARSLADQILRFYNDRTLLAETRRKAREYALTEGNLEFQVRVLQQAVQDRVLSRLKVSGTAETMEK